MKIKGFTLLELLITVFLLVGLSAFGVASYSYLLRNNEQHIILDELRIVMQYAKIQSLILGAPVSLTPYDASLDWSKGIILSVRKSSRIEKIHQWQWSHPQWSLTWNGTRFSERIIFSNNPATAISNGHFTLINRNTQKKTVIILNRLGRIKVNSLSHVG